MDSALARESARSEISVELIVKCFVLPYWLLSFSRGSAAIYTLQ